MTKFRQPSLVVTFPAIDHSQRRFEISSAHNLRL
jgi:hypothetical protein